VHLAESTIISVVSLALSCVAVVVGVWGVLWRARFDNRLAEQERKSSRDAGIAQARESWRLDQLATAVTETQQVLFRFIGWAFDADTTCSRFDELRESRPLQGTEGNRFGDMIAEHGRAKPYPEVLGAILRLRALAGDLRMEPAVLEGDHDAAIYLAECWDKTSEAFLGLFFTDEDYPGLSADWDALRAGQSPFLEVGDFLQELHEALSFALHRPSVSDDAQKAFNHQPASARWLHVSEEWWRLTPAAERRVQWYRGVLTKATEESRSSPPAR
jgi:hypothetical protein